MPSVPPTGFLCKMLASGRKCNASSPSISLDVDLSGPLVSVCHSDQALLDDTKGRPGFWDRYTLVTAHIINASSIE